MSARDIFGGVASLLLMLAKIFLCLMFAVYDRLSEAWRARGASATNSELPAVRALET